MKQEINNEIDLLLRRLSRRQEVPVSDADSRIDSDHLDADELSAFAENVVPAAARARYTEHLADCSKCREIVAQLSASVPVVAAKETVTAAAPSGLRKFLASFFSPMVLRYAVPALGLFVVAAIGVVIFQSMRSPTNVAQMSRQAQSPPSNPSAQEPPSSGFYSADAPAKSSSPAAPRPSGAKTASDASHDPPPPSGKTSTGDTASPKRNTPVDRTEQQAVANEAPAPPPQPTATPSTTINEMRVDVEGRKTDQSGAARSRDLAKQKTVSEFEQKKAEDLQAARERAARPAARAASPQGAGAATVGAADSKAEKDSDDGEIKSVAGRRFRKQNGIWVDTAYLSGSSIVNLARGSEQYRALVADEPAIKTIADQLGGTIVVVWKGRTYRIR